ncbi:MAG: branched-chain amino acid ABC transporter permease [Caldilineaceae bacterium]|nr:branched-chain amino acid ABC transporter permease [Caldilineaceae bacterium]
MNAALLIDSLVRTLQVGSMYALMAIGLTLTFAVLKLPNFAHAELITIGAYAALVMSLFITSNPLIVMGVAFVVAALVAVICHRAVYRPLGEVSNSMYTLILASFAVGLILRYIVFLFVDRFDLFDKRIQVPTSVVLQNQWLTITNIFLWVVPTSIVLVIALSLLLEYTTIGREMRALADNGVLARIIGVPVERVNTITWILAGGLAGVGGALWGMYTFVNPLVGWLAILSVFAATVLGGMTSFIGTILGAYLVAFSENTVMQLLNHYLGIDFSFKPAIPFIIIILVLLIRPQGLTGLFHGAPIFRAQATREV